MKLLIGTVSVLFNLGLVWSEIDKRSLFNVDSLHGKFLDCHVRTAGIGGGGSGCFLSKELQTSYKYKMHLQAFGVTKPI